MSHKHWYLIVLVLLSVAAALLLPAMPQPLEYHHFADHRSLLGVANVSDVVSNLAFLIAGLGGLRVTFAPGTAFHHGSERWPYAIFFIGVALTALGSGYYHLAPDNGRLFWDRLPMTVAFMSLVSAQIVDRISIRAGLALLGPLLLIGVGSAVYWILTERAGVGNVMPYGVMQAASAILLLALVVMYPSRYTRGNDIYWALVAYLAAKFFETFDREVLALGHLVSGHTLKHLAAALSAVAVLRMLASRRLQGSESGMTHQPFPE